jgi:feruloyl-CoA synthase
VTVPPPARSADGLFACPAVTARRRGDGSWLLRSADPLGAWPPTVLASLRHWAQADPGHPLIAERDAAGGWRQRGYGEVAAAARAAGQALLGLGLGPSRPLLILSGNGVDHLVIALAAMTAGIPVAPVSTAYSLQSRDHARVRQIAAMIRPGAVFAADAGPFAAALDAVAQAAPGAVVITGTAVTGTAVTGTASAARPGAVSLATLEAAAPGPEVDAAYAALAPGSLAKVLFTSGSTGEPKGVLNTHGMLAANQQMIRQGWPFLADERPVIVDWLPWSHTFGGNHNVNMMLTAGGTIYVDGGRPAPALFGQSLANLADVPPTIYFNVPAGYAQLVPALEGDAELAGRFFSRLRLMLNAAAALPASLRRRLEDVTLRAAGRVVPVTSAWGLTETAPAATAAHYAFDEPACIGVPLPGAEIKLSPVEDAYELRVRGPMVTPGYFGRPDLTAAALDEEGYYRTGDAARLIDEARPEAGLAFRGRIAEDFKLTTGTFVRVGAVRTALLSAIPLLADAVIAGEGRDFAAALAWLNPAEARALLGGRDPRSEGEVITDPDVVAHLAAALAGQRGGAGSAARVDRMLVLRRPPDLDGGEITDKGYVNQRRVLRNRAALAASLYGAPGTPGLVIRPGTGPAISR